MSRKDWTITIEEMEMMRGNTEFWTNLFSRMTSEAFIAQAKHYIQHSSYRRGSNVTYDDAIMNTVLPEALKRIEDLEEEITYITRKDQINGS